MWDSIRRRRIIESNPIAEVVGEYFPVNRDGFRFRSLCPFHDDHLSTLMVVPATKTFMCSVCRTSGDVVDFVRLFDDVSVARALDMLEARAKP